MDGLLVFQFIILIFSIVIHEVSHGAMANYLGDPTAKNEGRLTLNPLKHIDPIGTVVVPLLMFATTGFIFGWAKPVPYNPNFLVKSRKYGSALVGLAGVGANFLIAVVFGILIRFAVSGVFDFSQFLNLEIFLKILSFAVYINLLLGVFNIMPIPPLDGSKIIFEFLPARFKKMMFVLEQYGIFILLIFIFFVFPYVISPALSFLFWLLTGSSIL